ncbi:ArsC family reductase [Shewanella sp. AS1]|uniref:ArsC family reductase n=1 Tax=Shewanella sp. AS1 TaxID=2907626 RepID=UPI001F463854|nr:ArsC family reductase [Shewanella sp. AS1]MCE9678768.1 ArsC family reductase [Shewanella sp. AS1]
MTLYGIKNCDTVKKARKWLETNQQSITFHDFREDGLDRASLESWAETLGWEALFNKRSTSFRNLSEDEKADLNQDKAIELMCSYPTLIKRPILVHGDQVLVGFNAGKYQELFTS